MKSDDATIKVTSPDRLHGIRRTVLGWTNLEIPLDNERQARHFAVLMADKHLVGGGSCGPSPCPLPALAQLNALRFWGVAVLHPFQGRGLGSEVLNRIIATARDQSAQLLWANARESAVPYYEGKGFDVLGEPFTDVLSGLTDRVVALRLQ